MREPRNRHPPRMFCALFPLLLCISAATPLRHRRSDEQQQDSASNAPPVVFRYQCPNNCFCVPDIVHIELLMVSCRWTRIRRQSFAQFPRTGTKSLSIQCSGEGPQQDEDADYGDSPNDGGGEGSPFDGFSELRELRITGCGGAWLQRLSAAGSPVFAGAPSLRALHLSQMGSLRSLDAQFFAGLSALEQLTLAGTALRQFPPNALCALTSLQVLNASSNALSSPSLDISPGRCQLGQLLMADLSGNRISALGRAHLEPFPALRQLALAANGMQEIEEDAFRGVPVQHLDLSRNALTELPSLPAGTLQLDLSRNRLRRIPPAVAELAALEALNMSDNGIPGEGLHAVTLSSASLERVDLSANSLLRVPIPLFHPDSLATLKSLSLAANQIGQLEPAQMANLSALKQLDLSDNRITALPAGVFEGLVELQQLNLDNNSIGVLDAEVFAPLGRKLHSLGMSRNQLTELPMAVGRLHRVKRIDLSQNQIAKGYQFVLNKLAHLTRLDLSRNALEAVESYVFSDCAHLVELSLGANRIETLSADAFEKCPRLRRLDLGENRLAALNGALAAVHSLRWANLSANALAELDWTQFPDELLELDATHNRITRVRPQPDDDDARKLRRLNLAHNALTRLSADALPSTMEELDLAHNELAQLANNSFGALPQLKVVNVRSNRLRTLPRDLFEQTVRANAPFGQLWVGDNPLECNCEMGWLTNATVAAAATPSGAAESSGIGGVPDIGEAHCLVPLSGERRPIASVKASEFLCPYTQICAPGCLCCQYKNCDCKSRCPAGCSCFRDLHSVTNVVRCQRAGKAPSATEGDEEFSFRDLPMQASHLLLSGLDIPALKANDFFGRDRLLELHLNNSNVQSIQPSAFNTLTNLRALHLSGNQLRLFNGDEGYRTANIRTLDLSGNLLAGVDAKLGAMAPQLEALHLADNALEELPHYLRSPFSAQLRRVGLGGNPFRCDCASAQRVGDAPHWIDANLARVEDPGRLLCVENVTRAKLHNDTRILSTRLPTRGDHLFVMPMLEFLREENRSLCIAYSYGVFGVGGLWDTFLFFCAMCLVAVLIGALMIACRWNQSDKMSQTSGTKVRLIGPNKNNNNSLSSTSGGSSPMPAAVPSNLLAAATVEDRQSLLNIDIFVSYNAREEQLLTREFCSVLEAEGFSLCLLHQCGHYHHSKGQFQSFSEGLNQLVQRSRALVMFVTPEFMANEWQSLQVSMSHMLGRDKLIIYVSDRLENKLDELPKELGDMIRRKARLWRYWRHSFSAPSFSWNDLLRALRDIDSGQQRDAVSLSSSQHIYSEYGTIAPAVESAFV